MTPLLMGMVLSMQALALDQPSSTIFPEPDPYSRARREMIQNDIHARGIGDRRVLAAMQEVPRHLFVPEKLRQEAYADYPLPIGEGQTISQPYIVALMTELLELEKGDRVLEVGTGSGYQAAVLAAMDCEVYSIEIIEALCIQAERNLRTAGIEGVSVIHGDGYFGLPEKAPFDGIIVTAAPDHVPAKLVEQIKPGGRMVLPVGPEMEIQNLTVIAKDMKGRTSTREVIPVRFVPLTGGHERRTKE